MNASNHRYMHYREGVGINEVKGCEKKKVICEELYNCNPCSEPKYVEYEVEDDEGVEYVHEVIHAPTFVAMTLNSGFRRF